MRINGNATFAVILKIKAEVAELHAETTMRFGEYRSSASRALKREINRTAARGFTPKESQKYARMIREENAKQWREENAARLARVPA